MSKDCRFCCKSPGDTSYRLANGTIPPIEISLEDRYGAVFTKYPPCHVMGSIELDPPVPTVVRNGEVLEVYRWKCKNIIGQECCSCCRPNDVLLPWELTRTEAEQMVDGIVIFIDA